MSRKVICVCRQPKCSTGLKKTRCICLEICFPGRTSGVSEHAAAAAACVSSKREGERADTLIISQATMCSSTCSNLQAQLLSDAGQMFPATRCSRTGRSSERRGRRIGIFSGTAHNKSLIMNNTNELFVLAKSSLAWPPGNCFWLPYGGSCPSKK